MSTELREPTRVDPPVPPAGRTPSSAPAPAWYPIGDDLRRTAVVGVGTVLAFAPLFVIFTDWTWLIDAIGATLCVLIPAMALRYRSLPRTIHLLPGLVLLVFYCTGLYLSDAAIGGLVPGPQAWQELVNLREVAAQQIHDSVSPLPSTTALRTFVVPGLGLFAALVDWYAVVRRAPALAGVPLLALFTVCGAIAGSTVGWMPFTSAATGFLLILSADSRINLLTWGRVVPRRHTDHPTRARLGRSGSRIGVIAVIAAVAIPAVLPGLSRNLLADAFHGDGSGGSSTDGTSLSPFADLKGQLVQSKVTDLAQVTVSGTDQPYFLRSKVLDRFIGSGWVASGSFGGGPVSERALSSALPESGSIERYSATIRILGLNDVAPLFGSPESFTGLRSSWRFDPSDGTLGATKTSRNETYTESVVAPVPTKAELAASPEVSSDFRAWVALPADFPAVVRQKAAALTAAARTPYGRAIALYDFFKDPANGFVYSLTTKAGDSGNDLVDFLNGRAGYCQQYAAALAAMFRAVGIPSRVVLGYTHPAPDKDGRFTITSRDAHAWVEGYFTGIGWLPFNPTPLTGDNAARNVEVPYAPPPAAASTTAASSSAATSGASGSGANRTTNRDNEAGENAGGPIGTGSSGLPGWLIVLLALVGLIVIGCLVMPGIRALRRRSRFRTALHNGRLEPLWQELRASAVDTGTAWPDSTTPRQVPDWLRERGVAISAAIVALAEGVERERYAPAGWQDSPAGPRGPAGTGGTAGTGGSAEGATEVSDAIDRVLSTAKAMRATLSRAGRLRALLIPGSLTMRWRRRQYMTD